jgi:hypothetical protein
MNTEQTIALVMLFLGCMIGIAITICAYVAARRRRSRVTVALPDVSPQEQLTAMAVMAMLTAYRCVERKDLDGAKSSLADFVATWCGMIARRESSGGIPGDTLALVRSECKDFPLLARLIEIRIQEWKSKSIEAMIEEMEKDLANQPSQPIAGKPGSG